MSHEEHAQSLSRWLDQLPGTLPPDALDDDVVEAVYVLRPDLAPAPRLSADDILASITAGPLAQGTSEAAPASSGSQPEAEVVPFPGAPRPTPEPQVQATSQPRGRFALWIGGTSSAGLALVAAATLLLVVSPSSMDPAPEEAHTAAAPTTEAPATRSAAEVMLPPPAPSPAVPAQETAPRLAASKPQPEADLYEMGKGAASNDQLIPELAGQPGDGVAAVDMSDEDEDPARAAEALEALEGLEEAARASAGAAATPSPAELAAARAAALPTQAPQDWRGRLDPQSVRAIEDVLARADALETQGDLTGAARLLEGALQPPAGAAQHLATRSAGLYLRSGDPTSAASVARKGLGYSSTSSPARSQLLVSLGDALDALGDRAAALDTYQQAR